MHDEANVGSRGFGFTNVDALTIENVRIENCGGIMPLPGSGSNNSYFAVISLNHSSVVHLRNVEIVNYTGYALVGIDVSGSLQLQAVSIQNSNSFEVDSIETECLGSGAVFYYTSITVNTTLTLTSSSFIDNINCARDLPVSSLIAEELPISVSGSGGLTVVLENKSTKITITASNCTFQNNAGITAGAVLLLYLNYPFSGIVNFDGCHFIDNSVMESASYQTEYRGKDIAAYYKFKPLRQQCNGTAMDCLIVRHSMFGDTPFTSESPSPHISLLQFTETYGACNVTLSDVQCNHPSFHGCLYAIAESGNEIGHNLNIEMIDVSYSAKGTLANATAVTRGIFTLMNLGATVVRGSSTGSSVFENSGQSVFYAYATDLHLSGTIEFRGNEASLQMVQL